MGDCQLKQAPSGAAFDFCRDSTCCCEGITVLKPFSHQVSGHCSLLMLDDHTLCKPYTAREHQFYICIDGELRTWMPQFRGVIEVCMDKDNNRYLTSNLSLPVAVCRRKLKRPKRTKLRRKNRPMNGAEQSTAQFHYFDVAKTYLQNPWAIQCQTVQLARMRLHNCQKHRFLLLENLVHRYKYPCVLDLKMGIRHYGDDASENKRIRQTEKSLESTSSVLAVRLAGMQIYDQRTKMYRCYDKYYGRSLSVQGFKNAVRAFFNNTMDDLIGSLKERLEELRKLISNATGYRFYSSSLLVIYEGDQSLDKDALIDMRMIDFGHSTCHLFTGDPKHVGPDQGYLRGIASLIDILQQLQNETPCDQ